MKKFKKTFVVFAVLSLTLLSASSVLAAKTITDLTVIDISTPQKPGYAIYWPEGKGTVSLERSADGQNFGTIASTDKNMYIDYAILANTAYVYRLQGEIASVSESLSGLPQISEIKVESGTTTKDEASVIISFKTDKLAKSQILYGEDSTYGYMTDLDENLNQSHIILIEKLKPNTTYHFKAKALDKKEKEVMESSDQTFTTEAPPEDTSILEIIIRALSKAFSDFEQWLQN